MATIKMNNNGTADPNLALLFCPPPSPPQSPPAVFSEMEKMAPAAEVEEAEERCSALWNQIKDASVLRGPELTDSLLVNLQLRADFLAQQIEQFDEQHDFCAGAFTNAQLRLACVRSALEQLRRRKTQADAEEEAAAFGQQKRGVQLAQFRKWLLWQQAELARIRQRIPRSRNSLASLRELEAEQKALQEQIQTEGRTKHQQLCNNSSSNINNSSEEQRSGFLAKSDSKEVQHTEALEQRYLALWLSSLESLEIIDHFKARLEKKCLADLSDHQQLEEGPDPKRRRTLANQQQLELQKVTNNSNHWTPEQMTTDLEQHPHLAVPSKAATVFGDAGGRKLGQRAAGLGSDIGYSSGENNSLHEGTTNTKSIEESAREMLSSVEESSHIPQPWAEQIAQSSELEKSFYRTVPLDEFGMTDLDTDDGQHQWPSCLAQKFMEEMEKGGPGLELTDSLIVHVDSPESRQLNDFEEVMDLLDQQQTEPGNRRPEWPVFSEDDLESLSSAADTGRRPPMPRHPQSSATATPGSRKRTLVANRTPMTTTPADQSSKLAADTSTPRRKKQQQQSGSARRKWAAVRKHRSSAADVYGNGLNNSYVSSDFEWDEDFPMAGKVSMLGGQRAGRGAAKQMELGEFGDELPDIDVGSPPFLLARKKALSAFRDGLRQAAADSGNVSARLQQLLALVDKSLGGVDSAAYLLAELRATFGSLSSLCQSLESKMATFGQQPAIRGEENKENCAAGKWTRSAGHMKDIIESELMLCHERMNALETTCNNLALLLGTHIGDGNSKCKSAEKLTSEEDRDYLAQFASECNRIREEVLKLKSKFGEKFVFCSIQLPSNGKTQLEQRVLKVADCSAQTSSAPMAVAHRSPAQREGSFWRSYLLLCLLGFVASLGTMLYTQSRESTDWRWSFGPQLHYENGPPPF